VLQKNRRRLREDLWHCIAPCHKREQPKSKLLDQETRCKKEDTKNLNTRQEEFDNGEFNDEESDTGETDVGEKDARESGTNKLDVKEKHKTNQQLLFC
jgi:hypothetical protein